MMEKIKKNLAFSFLVLVFGIFAFADFASAQSCPYNTTVEGTSVTFVGELTDLGGDASTSTWFEYGITSNLNKKTNERILTQPGIYCISLSGLETCTTYYYRAVAKNSIATSYGEVKTFTTSCKDLTVNLKVNGSNHSTDIDYGSSATLSWTSKNADYCYASNAWSGSKAISGNQSTGSLTSSKTYTITCNGEAGSVSDSVTVYVGSKSSAEFSIKKTVRNLSQEGIYSDLIYANPGEKLAFGIVIKAGNNTIYDVTVKDTLPAGLIYQGDLIMVDDVLTSGNILTGLNIGNLSAGEQKTIIFKVDVAGAESFSFGQTQLTNTVSVSSGTVSHSDEAKIIVSKAAVAGIATSVSTGLTNNIFLDSFFFPLIAALLIVWLFKSRIIRFEEWLDLRKKNCQTYKSKKALQFKIAKIKTKELFRQKI
jgi:uncharacterized repeat protein (TIGR01451 family)